MASGAGAFADVYEGLECECSVSALKPNTTSAGVRNGGSRWKKCEEGRGGVSFVPCSVDNLLAICPSTAVSIDFKSDESCHLTFLFQSRIDRNDALFRHSANRQAHIWDFERDLDREEWWGGVKREEGSRGQRSGERRNEK